MCLQPMCYLDLAATLIAKMSLPLSDYHQRNALVWAAQDKAQAECGVHIIDPLPSLCDSKQCSAMEDGVVRYYDDNHLSEAGNRQLINKFQELFNVGTSLTSARNYPR